MINDKELNLTQISPTKRDFYQVWTELLDVSKKLSDRWDPTSTNESDPGIVLLKVLTACTDKLNYNIDKSVLELFMPSVTQEDSMRKLCEMLGYNIKYYQSATTDITLSYKGELLNNSSVANFSIPKFTQLQNDDGTINYTTLEPGTFTVGKDANTVTISAVTVPCIEGTYQVCSTNDGELITIDHIDDNQRYYLPEAAIAENGIFIQNWIDTAYSQDWEKVDNLNIIPAGTTAWKFGFDSNRQMPYVQFPEDISSIIEDGLRIAYIRTSGINGNISARTISKIADGLEIEAKDSNNNDHTIASGDFVAVNKNAAMNGANIETIDEAYDGYKRTIGTFDTLVTCRDYMNKIYNLYTDDGIPLVSNIIVSDIRDDINRSVTLCSFNEYGINYIDTPVKDTDNNDTINNFDLVLYPFKTVYGINNKAEYTGSFTIAEASFVTNGTIEGALEDCKTISHNFTTVNADEIACIKNYLKLNARITTTYRVNTTEESDILNNIYTNIYKSFNMRKMEFGEDIPYDTILSCIENSDERIKNVSLDEPQIATKVLLGNGTEFFMDYDEVNKTDTAELVKKAYNKLLLRNILAGKVPLFNYNTDFSAWLTESVAKKSKEGEGEVENYNVIYGGGTTDGSKIGSIETSCAIDTSKINDTGGEGGPITLTSGEVIQFRAPNYRTTITYPAYVNYFIKLIGTEKSTAIPATMQTLDDYVKTRTTTTLIFNTLKYKLSAMFKAGLSKGYAHTKYTINEKDGSVIVDSNGSYGVNLDTAEAFALWSSWVQEQKYTYSSNGTGQTAKLLGIYYQLPQDLTRLPGELVDINKNKYQLCTSFRNYTDPVANYFVQQVHNNEAPGEHTVDGLGKNAVYMSLEPNEDYKLQAGEYLVINYTESSDTSSNIKYLYYGQGDIIRANFNLIDSLVKRQGGASYTKANLSTADFKYAGANSKNNASTLSTIIGTNAINLFTLGTNEQIEIREKATVKLNDKRTYIYWTLNRTDDSNLFEANEKEYTLQDGEYFYYTDQNKLDFAFYGSGTKITCIGNPTIVSKTGDTSVENINELGIDQIPWVLCNFDSEKYLELTEYQYVNLTASDSLNSVLTLVSKVTANEMGEAEEEITNTLNNDFYKVKNDEVRYISGGIESALPKISNTDDGWEAKSKLELNFGPELKQTLTDRDTVTIKYVDSIESIEIKDTDIKANYATTITNGKYALDTNEQANFKIKVFKDEQFGIWGQEEAQTSDTSEDTDKQDATVKADVFKVDLVQGNLNNYWTKILCADIYEGNTKGSDEIKASNYAKLSILIPDNCYGLLFIYYISKKDIVDNYAKIWISTKAELLNYAEDITAYKNTTLKPGINILKLKASSEIKLYPDTDKEDIIILGQPDIVNTNKIESADDDGLNLTQIPYCKVDEDTDAKQLLSDIRALDTGHKFYYNCLIDNSTAIDFNDNLDEKESLVTPTIWYDYNNSNNKFVISEISDEDMRKGITIARTSKR